MILRVLCLCLMVLPVVAGAEDARLVRLYTPEALAETGLLKHILPRFTLKTQVRVAAAESPDAADMVIGGGGTPLFEGAGQVWRMELRRQGHEATDRFAKWLKSDVGQRTIQGFAPGGVALFAPPSEAAPKEVAVTMEGDARLGHKVSRAKCTRCHAVDDATRGWGIGSTPSFGVLRALPDWEQRFAAFFALNPHPAFTQIDGITEPFPIDRPSPIAPIRMTLDDLEAMLAYVAAMPAADLGQPLQHQ